MNQEFSVGVIFFLALGILFYFTIVVDDFGSSILEDSEVSYHQYHVRFHDAGGIENGTKVWVSGLNLGWAKNVSLLKTGEVGALLEVNEKLTFHEDYTIVVRTTELLGGRHIEIDVGTSSAPVISPEFYQGQSEPNLSAAVSALIAENRTNVRATIEQLRQVSERLNTGEGTIGKLLTERAVYDRLYEAIGELKSMVSELREGRGTLGRLLTEDRLHQDLEQVMSDLRSITGDLRGGKGTIGRLLADESLYEDLKKTLSRGAEALERIDSLVAGVQAGQGTIGMLFQDKETKEALQETAQNIREVTGRLQRGEGTLGRLLVDGELYSKLLNAVDDVQIMTRDMRSGKGTLGKIIRDEALYVDLRRAIRSILHSVEDAREQAPISLFTSVIFNAF